MRPAMRNSWPEGADMAAMEDNRAGSGTEETGGQFATFFVDNLLFGVEVLRVQEVLRYQQMTSVPRAPEVIEGLINLRGQIVTAIDMRRRLGLKPRAEDRSPMNMVVRSDDGAVSLLVDEIGDVLEVDESAFESAPENVDGRIRELTTGMYKLKDRLLLILDTKKAIDVSAAGAGPERA
jgi:purine-binding chemotaxis protein CheW